MLSSLCCWLKKGLNKRLPISALLSVLSLLLVSTFAVADNKSSVTSPLRIAVSANFSPVLKLILPKFEQQTGISSQVISGATGVLFQQIQHGAPFDIFLAADSERPQRLQADNLIIANSKQTYAFGQLALWSAREPITSLEQLNQPAKRFAIANPEIAPYGKAAKQVLVSLGLWSDYQDVLIQGININQTFQQIRSQAVNSGLVSYSQLALNNLSGVVLPQHLHQPIEQQLVILKNSKNIAKAQQLSTFLLSHDSQKIILAAGYLVAQP